MLMTTVFFLPYYLSSSFVAGLRKHTNCCAMYGIFLNISYNADKSYCMVINSKSHDMKNIHCVNLNNQFYTIK